MAHFAQLDSNNYVVNVVVVSNDVLDPDNEESSGIAFLNAWSGQEHVWKQTSYSGKFRGSFAGIGWRYYPERDVFIAPQPFPSWVLNTDLHWCPPIAMPDDGGDYLWDETERSWIPFSTWQPAPAI